MDNKLRPPRFSRHCKDLIAFLKEVSTKILAFIKHPKQIYFPKASDNILNKITKEHTWSINRAFLIFIFVSCSIVATTIYYKWNSQFAQQLHNKTELAHTKIKNTISAYYVSLTSLGTLMLDERRYLDHAKVLQILKLGFTTDENIKLLPASWHPTSDPYKAFTAHGHKLHQPDVNVIEILNKSPDHFMMNYKLDQHDEAKLIMYFGIKKDTEKQLIGYFQLPVKASIILQDLYSSFTDGDLLKISHSDKIIYFSKQNGKFRINQDPLLQEYKFSNNINFTPYDYNIAVGQELQVLTLNILRDASFQCGIIIIFGSMMMLIYNYIERKRIKNSYNELFSNEVSSIKEQMQNSISKLALSVRENEDLQQVNNSLLESARIITDLEYRFDKGYSAALVKVKDYNNLLVKHYSKEKILKPEIMENIFANTYQISEDLRHNIVSRNDAIAEVDLAEIVSDILTLFRPLVVNRSITLINKVNKTKIKINELLFKQIVLSLIAKALYSLPKKHSLTIDSSIDEITNRLNIEISDNGLNLHEDLFEDILYQKKKNILPGMLRIQLSLESIEILVKETLGGDLNITSTDQGNSIKLLLPLEANRADNVVPLPKIIGGRT